MPRFSFQILLTAGLVLLSGSPRAETVLAGPIRMESSSVSASTMEPLAAKARQAQESTVRFLQSLGLDVKEVPEIRIRAYATHPEMVQVLPKDSLRRELSTMGFFDRTHQVTHFWASGNADEMERILRHEMVHQVIRQNLPGLPNFLDEALAEALSRDAGAFSGQELSSKLPFEPRMVLKGATGSKTSIDLKTLEAMSRATFYTGDQALNYSASYGYLAYLYHTQGARVLGNLLRAAANGEMPSAWLERSGVSTSTMAVDMQAWAIQ